MARAVPEGNPGTAFLCAPYLYAPPLHLPSDPGNAAAEGVLSPECIGEPFSSEEERGNLLGECEVILSFLSYNDIQGMSFITGKHWIL